MDKKKVTKKQINEKLARLIKQSKAEKAKIKHIKLSFSENRFGPLVFALLFAGIGSFFIFKSSAAPINPASLPTASSSSSSSAASSSSLQKGHAASASLWLQPATQKAVAGSTVTAEIWVDTAKEQVNAIEADLNYPIDKLEFVGIDASSSAFSIQAQADGDSGKVTIARGNIKPVSGKQMVAKVTFKPIASSGQANIAFSSSSSVLRASDSSNVLSVLSGAQYTLSN
jgi:hypothetical protein